MQNYVSINEHQVRPNPALAAAHGQAALLPCYDVPIYYVSRQLLAAAARTELPDNMVFEAMPFPCDGLVFMLPKGTVRHPADGDCPFLVLSRTSKGQHLSPADLGAGLWGCSRPGRRARDPSMPEAEFNVSSYKIWCCRAMTNCLVGMSSN
jgi:hypothetical protein